MDAKLPDSNPNTREHCETAFQPGGLWERSEGRRQTRLFAECFHHHVSVPLTGSFSVLDAGCAMGDALPVWRRRYPQARLFGCDIAQTAVDRCREEHGDIAEFCRAGIEEIDADYDVIYCSNTLEHFAQYLDMARLLLSRCRILYIMTPYAELRNGRPLVASPDSFHAATFYEDAFDALKGNGAASIETRIVRCPGAWSPSLATEIYWSITRRLGLSKRIPARQIIYTLEGAKLK
jgi:SAM-dependent methyltransferase